MKVLCAIGLVLASVFSSASAQEKIDSGKLAGHWEIVKGEKLPPGAAIEFTKTGKVLRWSEDKDKKIGEDLGTYKLVGDKLRLTSAQSVVLTPDEVDTVKILTDEKLVLIDPQGKEIEMKRLKR